MSAALGQIVAGFLVQGVKVEVRRVRAVVEEDLAAAFNGFNVDEDVDQRRAGHVPSSKWPLIAFEEDSIEQVRQGWEVVAEEFAGDALVVNRDEAGEHLHVAARDIPAEVGGGQAKLRFGEIGGLSANLEG